MKNRIGAEKIISVYWFAILFIVAGAIVYMVSNFYGNPYDVRYMESSILISKIGLCISDNSMENLRNNLVETCTLDFNTNTEDEKYYVEVVFYDFENSEKELERISAGNINLKDNPNVDELSKYSKSLYVSKDGKEMIAVINTVINKEGENVKL